MIEQQNIRIHRGRRARDLLQLARANQGCWIRPVAALQHFARHLRSRAFGERPQFGQRFVRVELGNDGPRLYRCIFSGGSGGFRAHRSRVPGRRGVSRNRSLAALGTYFQPHQKSLLSLRALVRTIGF